MSKNNKDPIIRSLVNAFVPVIVNKEINCSSVQTSRLAVDEGDNGVSIRVQVIIHKAIVPILGFEPTHAAIIFDLVFKDCKWIPALENYEWVGGIYDIHYGRMTRNILWSDDRGQLLEMFSSEDNKDMAKKVMIDLLASVNPRITRSFLDSVLASTGKLAT